MRSFPTCLVDSATWTVLLAPCLLICVACATPFPIENLEEGMTTETVRENFGEPEAIETEPGVPRSDWTYVHEEKDWWQWFLTFLPLTYPVIPLDVAFGNPWDDQYVIRGSVVLHFAGEKLVRWDVPYFPEDYAEPASSCTQMSMNWPHCQPLWFLMQEWERERQHRQLMKDLEDLEQ
jgi:hypothetical protein